MSIEIKLVEDPIHWDQMVKNHHPNSLLQSSMWWNFTKLEGQEVFPIGIYQDDFLVGGGLAVAVKSRRGNYLVCQGGPVLDWSNRSAFVAFHQYVLTFAREKKMDFFRIRPLVMHEEKTLARFLEMGYLMAPMYFPAEHTLVLDLRPNLDDIFANIRKNTRYYIRRAEKNGVEITVSQNREDLDKLYDLYLETVQRQKFTPYDKEYFYHEFDALREQGGVDILLGYHNGQVLAGAMVLYFDRTAYYHHGASRIADPDVFTSYLLQWQAIQCAKEKGMESYDFWGVAPSDKPTEKRAGLTLFKRGFGGERVRYLHTLDYPISWRYWLTYAFVKWERWRKGL
jgi:lipid II:glycine glycyltransferase (peptidoglycan interpeptide bridge formation enzyme)